MTTAANNPPPAGQPRGRGLDALFDSAQPAASDVPEIDPELAAMLEREVRAGAPPVGRVRIGTRDAATTTDNEAAGEEEAIDVPAPIVEPAVTPSPSPAAGQPAAPGPAAPSAPAATIGPTAPPTAPSAPAVAPTPAAGAPATQPPVRIGAVIIDTTAPAAPAPAETGVEVGPAGELIPTGGGEAPIVTAPRPELREARPPGPGVSTGEAQLPAVQTYAPDQRTIVINRLNSVLDAGWQKAIHRQIDDLYKQVAAEFSSPPANTERMLTMLQEARQILIETPENFVAAEARLAQVRVMMTRMKESRKQAGYYGPRILGYEMAWVLLFLLGIIFAAPLSWAFTGPGNILGATIKDVFPFWNTLMWGGVGGVIGALYALWWHISDRQDFDRHYLMWYLVQPVMGLVLGGIVFLLLTGGFLLLQVKPADENAAARLVPYLVAVLAGFRQNFIYEQFDRLISLFAPPGKKE
ncbi:MAG: hypothetical protein N2439_09435 [Anaerolineae bacterium]|nr:hypothetical protein [Anaerolineae bacterium]